MELISSDLIDVKLFTEETLAHSRAFIFILDHYTQLLKLGYGEPEFNFGNSSKVTYFYSESIDTVLSASVWSIDPNRRIGTIHFSATKSEYRKKGYYTKIFTEIERLMKVKHIVSLYSSVHVNNEQMLKRVESTGRSTGFYRTKKSL